MVGMGSGGEDGSVAAGGQDGVAIGDLGGELGAREARDVDVLGAQEGLNFIDTIFLQVIIIERVVSLGVDDEYFFYGFHGVYSYLNDIYIYIYLYVYLFIFIHYIILHRDVFPVGYGRYYGERRVYRQRF